jgi:hypothetical protein
MRLCQVSYISAYCLPYNTSVTKVHSNSAKMFDLLVSLFRTIVYNLKTIIFGLVVRLHFSLRASR